MTIKVVMAVQLDYASEPENRWTKRFIIFGIVLSIGVMVPVAVDFVEEPFGEVILYQVLTQVVLAGCLIILWLLWMIAIACIGNTHIAIPVKVALVIWGLLGIFVTSTFMASYISNISGM
jgi:hypothetical protein